MLASAGGAFSAMLYMWLVYGKPDPGMMVNGMLAGLVAITAPCAFVTAPVAVHDGFRARAVECVGQLRDLDVRRFAVVDDEVGASAVQRSPDLGAHAARTARDQHRLAS